MTLLAGVALFAGCSKAELARIARLVDEVEVEEDRVLIRQGDLGREAFVIVSGHAEAWIGERKVADLGAGDCFGEMALLAGSERTATVKVTSPMQLLVLDSRSFAALIDEVPAVARKVLRQLAKRVVANEHQSVPH